jgi:outer membrane protein TolC
MQKMNCLSQLLDSRRPLTALGAVLAMIAATTAVPALAGPYSDPLAPDVFSTQSALQARMGSLQDPTGRDCRGTEGALSLSIAVDRALCANPATRLAWANARQAAAALGTAQGAWLPQLSATGADSRTSGTYLGPTASVVSESQTRRDAAVNLSWMLYDFGGRESRIGSAHALLDAAAASADGVVQQTVLQVVQAYYGLVAADDALAAQIKTESVYLKSLEIARSLQSGGVATVADLLQAETAYEQSVYLRVQAEAAAQIARGALAVVLGLPAQQPLKIAADPVPESVPGLSARLSDLMSEAMLQRPDLKAAQAARAAAEAQVGVARAAGRPVLAMGTGRTLTATSGIPQLAYSTIGITVTVPIFSGFSTAYGVRQAQALLQARDADVEQARLQVSQGVWNAYHGVQEANQELSTTARLIKTAESNEEVALGRYQSGVGSMLDVLTAETAAATARQLRISSELFWQVSRAQLALALGRLSGVEPLPAVGVAP